VSTRFASTTSLFYAGDFTGDSFGDLIARRSSGEAVVHPTTGAGGFKSAVKVASGWSSLIAVFSPGDFDGSGTSDIIAIRADGSVALARGNGKGGRYTSITIATGWGGYTRFG
jgi:hypothetical protein